MKPLISILILTFATSVLGQTITIDSIDKNGTIIFQGAEIGTTSTVEWAASLTDSGRTNWHTLTNIVVTSDSVTNDIPMFFRVRGIPQTKEYLYISGSFTWSEAKADAEARNGYLVTITSSNENERVIAVLISSNADNGWIGASDAEIEGVWKWVNGPEAGTQFWQGDSSGTSLGYNNWRLNQPSLPKYPGEDYALIENDGDWVDANSRSYDTKLGYILEIDHPPIINTNIVGIFETDNYPNTDSGQWQFNANYTFSSDFIESSHSISSGTYIYFTNTLTLVFTNSTNPNLIGETELYNNVIVSNDLYFIEEDAIFYRQ